MNREELEKKIECQKDTINQYEDIEIIKDYKQTKKHLKQLKQQLKDLPSLEVGKWYKSIYNESLLFIEDLNVGMSNGVKSYGFTTVGNWTVSRNRSYKIISKDFRKATDKEVEEALIKEAKKRGFKEGVCVDATCFGDYWYSSGIMISNDIRYNPHNLGQLCLGFHAIFKQGKWATIIEQPKVTINGDFTREELEKIINTTF